ncbi:MAG: hypothetical protein M3P91_06380 [Actinomycetota bacterium]|nr:hypothetical protein [Actinomycetota bacterium]
METVLFALAVLACPVGMGAMMWFMMRGGAMGAPADSTVRADELAALRREVTALRAERARETDSFVR